VDGIAAGMRTLAAMLLCALAGCHALLPGLAHPSSEGQHNRSRMDPVGPAGEESDALFADVRKAVPEGSQAADVRRRLESSSIECRDVGRMWHILKGKTASKAVLQCRRAGKDGPPASRVIALVDCEGGVVKDVTRLADEGSPPLPHDAVLALGVVRPGMPIADAQKALGRVGFTTAKEFVYGVGPPFLWTGMVFAKPVAPHPEAKGGGQARAVVVVDYMKGVVDSARTGDESDLR
jgi:hypothetical protein